jgi:hypothetical protein
LKDISESQRVWFLREMLEDSLTTTALARTKLVFSLFHEFVQHSLMNHYSTNDLAQVFGESVLVNEEGESIPDDMKEAHLQIVAIIIGDYGELFGQ